MDNRLLSTSDDSLPKRSGLGIGKVVTGGVEAGFKGVIGSLPGGSVFVEAINAAEKLVLDRRVKLIELAVEQLNANFKELGIKLNEEPELAELWIIAVEATVTARTEDKVKAFARILTDATQHGLPMSLSRVYLRIVEDLEEEHIRVMNAIESFQDQTPDPPIEGIIGGRPGASIEDLQSQLSDIEQIVKILINNLVSLELARGVMMNTWGQGAQRLDRYVLTDLGTGLIEFLRS